MATKKAALVPGRKPTTSEIVERLAAQDDVLAKLDRKLEDAHVLNGGFDHLMEKISKIDTIETDLKDVKMGQDTQVKKLDEVHKAIYDKDEGLYQKVKGALNWINTANWVIKGLLGLAGTAALTGAGKLVFDILTGHLLIHYTQ